jgi:hypothetical protein
MKLNDSNRYRSAKTPGGYMAQAPGRSVEWNKIYIGKIKDNVDYKNMGRLKVWIPELCGVETTNVGSIEANETDETNWILVSYATIFGGASNISDNTNENTFAGTQQSYGFWAVPPERNTQVAVFFANGDPSRGYWFACTFDEQMVHDALGPAADQSYQSSDAPSLKSNQNRKVVEGGSEQPERPVSENLQNAINTQGLNTDYLRGINFSTPTRKGDYGNSDSDLAAHKARPAKVYGLSSPGGHHFIMDDGYLNPEGNLENRVIRIRTMNGTQILLDNNTGFVYFITKDGLSWLEITDQYGGHVDVYSKQSVSVHAEEADVNIKAGNDIIMEAGRSIYMTAGEDIIFQAGDSFQTKSFGVTNFHAVGDMNILTDSVARFEALSDMNIRTSAIAKFESTGNMNIKTSSQMNQQSSGTFNINAGGNTLITAPNIHLNGPSAATAAVSEFAALAEPPQLPKRVPEHEPWQTHTYKYRPPSTVSEDPKYPTNLRGGTEEINPIPAPEEGNMIEPASNPPGEPYTGPLIGTICGLNDSETRAYLGVLSQREAAGKYTTVNSYNFLGKYQFGTAALEDIGYIKKGTTAKYGSSGYQEALDNPSNWTGKNGATDKTTFLTSQEAQESAIVAFTNKNCQYISSGKDKIPNFTSLPKEQVAGYLMAAHLKGHTGAKKLYRGIVVQDAYGTSTQEYYKLGAGSVSKST